MEISTLGDDPRDMQQIFNQLPCHCYCLFLIGAPPLKILLSVVSYMTPFDEFCSKSISFEAWVSLLELQLTLREAGLYSLDTGAIQLKCSIHFVQHQLYTSQSMAGSEEVDDDKHPNLIDTNT